MNEGLKRVVRHLMPRPVQRQLRRWYCPRQVRAFRPERWPHAAAVRRLLRPGDCVVDAGANIGYVTALLASWVGPSGRVHSIEPVPETCDLLRRAVRSLGLDQVQVHHCAVSDHDGVGRMEVPEYPGGGENFYESHLTSDAAAAGRCVEVPLRRLDTVLGEDAGRVAFVKMDVEGHEQVALLGATRLLERARPAWLIEVAGDLDDAAAPAGRLQAHLGSLGYAAYVWEGDALRRRAPSQRAVDYFFLQDRHLRERWGAMPGGTGENRT